MSPLMHGNSTIDHSALLDGLEPVLQYELSTILEDYIEDLERGVRRDPDELIAEYPDLAEPLKLYLGSLDFLHRAAADLGAENAGVASAELPHRELGDYQIKREIGRGGMGVVYEAEQLSLGRKVALKVLPFAAVLDQKQIARFNNEAQAAGQLNHPNIVPVYGVGCDRGVHYYSMQFIDGQPLDRAIHELRVWAGEASPIEAEPGLAITEPILEDNRDKPDSVNGIASPSRPTNVGFSTARSVQSRDHLRMAAELGVQAAEALHHAHEYGVIHRDVKPSNLLIDHHGKLWITDFGLARCQTSNSITMTGDLLGTVRYMSPEQAAGRGNLVDHRTDIYSLGVTLYELLTLEHAFGAGDRQALLRQIERDDPPSPRRLNPAIPTDLETIVLKATTKSREDRYESAQALAEDLGRFLEGKPTLARRPTVLDRAAKWSGRHRGLVAAVVVVLMVALAGTTVAALLVAGAQNKTETALQESKLHLAEAKKNLRKAREVVDRFGMDLADQLGAVPGLDGLRRSLLAETLRYYEEFVEQTPHDPSLRFDLALSYSKIAGIRERLGEFDEALAAYHQSREIYAALAEEQPEVDRFRHDLAICNNNTAHVLTQRGDTAQARVAYEKALELERALVSDHPQKAAYRASLAMTLTNLGRLQRQTGEVAAALKMYQDAVQLQQELVKVRPEQARFWTQLASSYNELSFLLGANDLAQAEHYNSKALAIHQRLLEASPDHLQTRADLATCYNNRGAIFKRNEQLAESRTAYELAIETQEQLVVKAPGNIAFQNELAVSYNNLGQLVSVEAAGDAEQHFLRARALFEQLVSAVPDSPKYRASLGGAFNNLGFLLENTGRTEEAVTAYEEAVDHQAIAFRQAPQVTEFRLLLSTSYVNFGRVLRKLNRPEAAAAIAMERKQLWPAAGERLFNIAGELAAATSLMPAANPPRGETIDRWTEVTVTTLEEAMGAGFRPPNRWHEAANYRNLQDHPRFQALLGTLAGKLTGQGKSGTETNEGISP